MRAYGYNAKPKSRSVGRRAAPAYYGRTSPRMAASTAKAVSGAKTVGRTSRAFRKVGRLASTGTGIGIGAGLFGGLSYMGYRNARARRNQTSRGGIYGY